LTGKAELEFLGASALAGAAGAVVVDYSLGPTQSALFGRYVPIENIGGFPGYLNSSSFSAGDRTTIVTLQAIEAPRSLLASTEMS